MDCLCRVCIKRVEKCTSLNSKIEESSNLSFLGFLNKCTRLNAHEGDWLPQSLCSICANSMKTFYGFVKLAEKSDIVLKEALKNLIAKGRYNGSGEISWEQINIRNAKIERGIEELDEMLSCTDRRVASIDAGHSDAADEASIILLKNKLGKNEDEVDTQNKILFQGHWIPSNVKKKAGETEPESKEIIKQEILDPQIIVGLSGLIDNSKISCEEITIRNEKIKEDFKDFNKEDSLHCQPNKNSTGSSLYILEIVKEEPRISEGTSIVAVERAEMDESESTLIYPEKSIEEPDDVSSCVDRRLTIIDTEYADSEEEDVPITSLKSRSVKYEAEADSQINACEEVTIRNKTIEHRCEICGKKFSLKHHLKVHLENHKGITQKCDQCGKEYKNSVSLKNHMKCHVNPKAYTCETCGKFFAWKCNYIRHMQICKRPGEPRKLNKTKVACEICGKKFSSKKYRNFHMGSHRAIAQKCNQCNKEYYNIYTLRRHMKSHTNPKPFNCEYCGKSLATKCYYTWHMDICKRRGELLKLNKTKCACEICGKKFTRKASLDVHMEKHMGITHECDQCGKEYKNSVSLKMHMKWHANPKRFKCENCGKCLSRKYYYTRHMEICKSSDKPQQLHKTTAGCEICGKKFSRQYILNLHMKNHKGITQKCDKCNKEFENIYSLRRHLKWHTNPNPFKCESCGKFFAWKCNYARHMELCKPAGSSFEETVTIKKSSLHPKGRKVSR